MSVLDLLRQDKNKAWTAVEIAQETRKRLVDVYEDLVMLEGAGLVVMSIHWADGRSFGLWEAM